MSLSDASSIIQQAVNALVYDPYNQRAYQAAAPRTPIPAARGVGRSKISQQSGGDGSGIASPLTLQSRVVRTETITITPDMTFIQFDVTEARLYSDAHNQDIVINDELTA